MEEKLIELEDKITKFLESKEFDENVENENLIYDLMRNLKSMMVTYFEIFQKLTAQDLDSENTIEHSQNPVYIPQIKFIDIVECKLQSIFKFQRSSYLVSKGFVMNNKTIKILGEFLHAYINFIVKFKSFVQIDRNREAIEFVSEQLSNSQSQKDILTSCSIIFWNLLIIDKKIIDSQQKFQFLCDLLKSKDPITVFNNGQIDQQEIKPLSIGIIQMAKMRGYILSIEKESEVIDLLSQSTQMLMFPDNCKNLFDFILLNCEKNEGLQKLYSFNTLEAMVSKMKGVSKDQEDWLYRACKLLISYLKYPLPVSSCCESVIKKLLAVSNKEQVGLIIQIIKSLSQGHEVRAKYTALYIALNYMSVKEYLQENRDSVEEMITLSADSIIVGKFVTSFFEGLLLKLHDLASIEGQPQSWFESWIPAYMKAINSDDEKVRVSVCQNVTPILIKINKLSLAYILSSFLKYQNQDQSNIQLESLMILLRIARQNKMIQICDDSKDLKLQSNLQEQLFKLQEQGIPEFSIKQSDLLKIIVTNNWKMSLECFSIVAQETKAAVSQKDQQENEQFQLISLFEYQMCELFALQCTKTTFPEHRKHFMHSIRTFLTRVRSANLKKIKAYVASNTNQKCDDLNNLIGFLSKIIGFCEQNLYVDKPIEAALPFFEIIIMIQNFFGEFDYQLRVNHVLPAVRLLSKEKLIESKQLIMYLLNCLKSSWALVRVYSFEILCKIPDDNTILTDQQFINEEILSTALVFCNNPKAMIAEGASLLLKFLFKKCLKYLHFIKPSDNTRGMQLQFCQYILGMLKQRIQVFHHTLINEGKTSALLHGLLGFFKNLFLDFKIQREDLAQEEDFYQWRQFFKDFIEISLQISNLCSGLLGNNRIQDQEGNTKVFDQSIETDCRGHPIFDRSGVEGKSEGEYEDQDNLILVGVWLAEKENGLTLFNLLSWIELPNQEEDNNKFLQDQDILGLCDNILNLLFTYKHRGAIEKAAESFSLLCSKLLNSNRIKFKNIPLEMLQKAFERITTENHSTVLRRSAGIPPTILAILRAEPLSNEPILLNKTLEFLLDLARKSKDTDDAKIHALNILRFIFQDSFLKNDINKFIIPAMILATENFKSESWSIRNSALMCFTSLTKRLLNTTTVQEQDLSRKKGLSTWEFVSKYSQLSDYFKATLKDCLSNKKKLSKEGKERTDMVIFSILLLISRLVPSFQMIDSQNLDEVSDQQSNLNSINENDSLNYPQKSKEQSIRDFAVLIKGYAQSDTYFVRKISAQALLTIMKFDEYILEIKDCFNQLIAKIDKQKEYKLRQNEAHGLMIRINIFIEAFYQYRSFNMQMSTKSGEEQIILSNQQQTQLSDMFSQFFIKLSQAESTYQLIIVSLFIKSLKLFIQKSQSIDSSFIQNLQSVLQNKIVDLVSKVQQDNDLSTNYQVYLTDLTKTYMILIGKNDFQDFECVKTICQKILEDVNLIIQRTDFVFKFLKSLYQQLKDLQRSQNKEQIQEFLSGLLCDVTLPQIVNINDEKLCKVLEWSLKVVFRLNKHQISQNFQKNKENIYSMLSVILKQFEVNPCLTSLYIKLQTLMIDSSNPKSLRWIGKILRKHAYGDQKEIVRIASVKSISKILEQIEIQKQGGDCLDLIFASVLVLNDENPEVRSYLAQSKSVQTAFIDCEQYALKSQSLYQSKIDNSIKEIIVEVNEVILIQQIIQRMGQYQGDQDTKREIVNSFLLNDLLFSNPYREQNEKNYEEKIFLFEPINKYYDLLWLKRIAFNQLVKNENKNLIDKNKLNEYRQKFEITMQKWQQSAKSTNANVEIGESSLQFENKIDMLIIDLLSSQTIHVDSISTGSRAYLRSLV